MGTSTVAARSATGTLPPILTGRRRRLFARLLANGAVQAAAALALPFAILSSASLPVQRTRSINVA